MAVSLLYQRGVLIILLLSLFFAKSYGQSISKYAVSGSPGTYTLISGATIPTGSGTGENRTFAGIPIGFDFWYMGQRYTTVSASMKGWFTFGSTINGVEATNNLAAGGTRPLVAPLWDNIARIPGILTIIASGTFSYSSAGAPGSRRLTLQWNLMRWDLNAPTTLTIGGDVISLQAILYEGSGNIEFIYKPESQAVNNGSASAGITAAGTGSGNYISLSSIANTSASPPYSTTSETSTINTKPATVRSILFTPEKANAPTNLNFTEVGTSAIRLNWIDNSADELGFAIYRSTDNINFTYVGQTAANTTTFSNTGLAANTTYYYAVYAFRESLSNPVSKSQAANCQTFSLANIPSGNIIANYKFNGNANDYYGLSNGTLQGAPTVTINRFGIAGAAYHFNGSSQYVSTSTSYLNPSVFTISIWFRATVAGGKLIGLGSSVTGFSQSADRHIYMANDGKVFFGTKPNTYKTISSTSSYADGNWHMATATMSSAGIVLYIDGVQVASDATTTSGESYTGYWRIGYDNIDGWPSTPTNRYFTGDLDDVYIYSRALNASEVLALYNSGDGVTNNGPVCAGTTLTLMANTLTGATYAWTGPNGFTSISQNPTLAYSDAAKGTYTVTVTRNGCSATASTLVSSIGEGRWTGNVNANWSTADNWCNGIVPTAAVNVSIPSAGVVNDPVLITNGIANNIDVQTNRTLVVGSGGDLQIAGAITNNGAIVATAGKVTFNGTVAQTIPHNVFSTNTILNLELNNPAGVTLNGALRLTGNLTATAGVFNANGFLTLASSEALTAQVAPILNNASIQGQLKVERFVRGGAMNPYRTNRMLSSPVYDNTTVFTNSGTRSAKFSQLIDDIIVTGSSGAVNGFDASSNNQPSAWTYTSGFIPIANITTPVSAGFGMYVYFRGNRNNFIQKITTPYIDPEDTVVDFDGVLNQGDISLTLDAGNHFLGNPYAATIDWESASWGADKGFFSTALWIWNPATRSYATYSNGVGTLGGSRYIASGQSFFAQSSASGVIKFKESIKAVAQQPPVLLMSIGKRDLEAVNGVNSEVAEVSNSLLRINIKPIGSYGEDEAVIVFKEDADANYTPNDALHIDGEVVNVSSVVDNRRLAINFLPAPTNNFLEIPLNVSAAATGSYSFRFSLEQYYLGHTLQLKDNYLQKIIPIVSGSTSNFNIDKTQASSYGAGRFSIIVTPPAVLPIVLLSFTAKKQNEGVLLSWVTASEVNHKSFKLYRAGHDGSYILLQDFLSREGGRYTYLDAVPLPGFNFYKLVQVDLDGTETEIDPISVDFNTENLHAVKVYPNPVNDKFIVKMEGVFAEKCRLVLYDLTGRILKQHEVSKIDLAKGYEVDVLEITKGLFFIKVEEIGTSKIVGAYKIVKH